MKLLNSQALERSSVVANNTMNRERRLVGSNSYGRDLNRDVLAFLLARSRVVPVTWVDLCCGTGRALIEAASELEHQGSAGAIQIEGIDLAGMFDPNPFPEILTLHEQSIESWMPNGPITLLTCVHGLHYIGDKLEIIARAARSLAEGGMLAANLDLANFRHENGQPAGRTIAAQLRRNGLSYDTKRRLIWCEGPREVTFRLRYLGADDTAGANYTGQPAVDSYYSPGDAHTSGKSE